MFSPLPFTKAPPGVIGKCYCLEVKQEEPGWCFGLSPALFFSPVILSCATSVRSVSLVSDNS